MEKEKAIKEAEAFREDWELDGKKRRGKHKLTGFEIYMGAAWRDKKGLHYDAVIGYRDGDYPARQGTIEEINELQRQFGILYEAGYLPGMTKEEKAEESRRIHEEGEKSRAEFQAEVARQQEWIRTHPKEYEEWVKKNRENARKRKIQWFLDHELPIPDSLKNNER